MSDSANAVTSSEAAQAGSPAEASEPSANRGLHAHFRDLVPPSDPGWVAYAWRQTPEHVHSIAGSWVVPEPPKEDIGQTIFAHLGLQSGAEQPVILSAALQWGVSAAGGGCYWALACFGGKGSDVWASTYVQVEPGQKVRAGFKRVNEMGVPVWICQAHTAEESIALRMAATADEPVFKTNFGAVLEAYCAKEMGTDAYPASDMTSFTDLKLEAGADQGDSGEVPAWNSKIEVPSSGVKMDVVSLSQVDLYYR